MTNQSYKNFTVALCAALSLTLSCAAKSGRNQVAHLKQLQQTIMPVRTGKTEDVRYDAAYRLGDLTKKIDPKQVDDKTLGRTALTRRVRVCRGRDTDCSVPPTQIRTSGFPAYGSCLRW